MQRREEPPALLVTEEGLPVGLLAGYPLFGRVLLHLALEKLRYLYGRLVYDLLALEVVQLGAQLLELAGRVDVDTKAYHVVMAFTVNGM